MQRNRLSALVVGCVVLPVALSMACSPVVTPPSSEGVIPATFGDVVEQVMPSVVYFLVESEVPDIRTVLTSGSGVIMSEDGYVFTNRHVVEAATSIEVTLHDRSTVSVEDFWVDQLLDLAVVKLDATGLPAARFADPSALRIGDWVIAVGHPFGLSPEGGGATVTAGIVSNTAQSFFIEDTPYYDAIQTDAAVNPGNSGGPLVNLDGEVVGINSAGNPDAQSVGYAINVRTARRVYEDLVQYGEVRRAYLGARLGELTPEVVCTECLTRRIGVRLFEIVDEGPASAAGLRENDVIVGVDGEEIFSVTQLVTLLWSKKVGDVVDVSLYRNGGRFETSVVLGSYPS
ncbi:MAG: trypsin-like peptidase domain-containing protein [Dehalococcoidia bacterium]|nr:trypsin-like peptidase domain-containing protein [Dehalococcoidia bacterium]